MTNKKQKKQRNPEFRYVIDKSDLEKLIVGDLITIEFPNLWQGGRNFDIHCVYEGVVDERHAFMNLDVYLHRKYPIYSYRVNMCSGNLGNMVCFYHGSLFLDDGCREDKNGKLISGLSKEEYHPAWTSKKLLKEKVRIMEVGKKILYEMYRFDKVIYTDSNGRTIKEEKNKVLLP